MSVNDELDTSYVTPDGVVPSAGPTLPRIMLDDTGMPYVPGVTPAPGPVVHPSDVLSAPAPLVQLDPSKGKASVETKGITDHGIAQAEKARGPVDQRIAARVGALDKQGAEDNAALGAAYSGQADAVKNEAQVNADHFRRQNELDRHAQQMQTDFANMELQRQSLVKADREHYMGQYENQLAAVRQLTVQSGNPLETLSGVEAGGLSLAMFAQGFLAPAGIHIDVSGQVDRWVERSMREHQTKIANARQNASDTLNLYSLARQASQDDWEASQRYRGFVIEAAKQGVQAEASRWGSQVAVAAANEKIALLNTEYTKTKITLGQHRQDQVDKITQEEYTYAHNKAMEGIEGAKVQLERDKMNAAAKAKEKSIAFITNPFAVQRNEKGKRVSGPRRDYALDPNAEEVVKKDAIERVGKAREAADNMQRGLEDLRDLKKEMGTQYGPKWYKDRNSEAYRRFDHKRTIIVGDVVKYMSGLSSTPQEQAKYEGLLKDDRWLEHGGHASDIDDLAKWGHDHYDSAMHTPGVIQVPENMRTYEGAPAADSETSLQDARKYGGEMKSGYVDTQFAEAVNSKADRGDDEMSTKVVSGMWKQNGRGGYQPGWAVAIDHMASVAITGGEHAEEASKAIQRVAGNTGLSHERRAYAFLMMKQLETNHDLADALKPINLTDEEDITGMGRKESSAGQHSEPKFRRTTR